MSNTLKFCSCKMCRKGRHKTRSKVTTQLSIRRLRRECKVALRQGREPERLISIPYTD